MGRTENRGSSRQVRVDLILNTGIFDCDKYNTAEAYVPNKLRLLQKKIFRSNFFFYLDYMMYIPRYGLKMLRDNEPQESMKNQGIAIINMIEKYDARVILEGMNNFPAEKGPFVFASNHMSALDILILPGIISSRLRMTMVIKYSLSQAPFFGKVINQYEPIVLKRRHPGEDLIQVLKEGTERLSRGISVMLFPEATRQDVFSAKRFNSMAIKLAHKANVPVVPVALKTDFLGKGKIIKEFGQIRRNNPVRFNFGKPLHLTGRGRAEHQAVIDHIQTKITEWGG